MILSPGMNAGPAIPAESRPETRARSQVSLAQTGGAARPLLQYDDTADATIGDGDAGTYRLDGRCKQCGWTGWVLLSRGHKKPKRVECPCCGRRTVRP